MSALADLQAAVTNLNNLTPQIVAALQQGASDAELVPLTAAVTSAVSTIQAALPPG